MKRISVILARETVGCSRRIPGFQSCTSTYQPWGLGQIICLSLFITKKMEKITIISTSYTTLRIRADNDHVKYPASKHLWQPNRFYLCKEVWRVWQNSAQIATGVKMQSSTKDDFFKKKEEFITRRWDEWKVFTNGTLYSSC